MLLADNNLQEENDARVLCGVSETTAVTHTWNIQHSLPIDINRLKQIYSALNSDQIVKSGSV